MNHLRRYSKVLPFLVVLLLLVTACGSSGSGSASNNKGPINIAELDNQTGKLSSLGQPSARGAQLAEQQINAAGGVLGRKIKLDVYDTKSDSSTAANTATQTIESDHVVAGLGYADSDFALAAGPIFQQHKIPFLSTGATSPKLPAQVGNYMFMVPFGDNVQAAAGAEFAYNKLNGHSVYLLYDTTTEYTTGLAKYFEERFKQLGGKVLLKDTYKGGDSDYSSQITRLKNLSQKPDFLYIAAAPDDIGTIVKQFRAAGINEPIVGGDGYDTPLLVKIAGDAANNVYYSTHSFMDPKHGTKQTRKFMKAYKAKYGSYPPNAFAALGYDGVKLVVNAIKRAGSTDPKKIRDALANTKNFPGVTGQISYPKGKRIPQKTVFIIKVQNKQLHLEAQVVPKKIPAP